MSDEIKKVQEQSQQLGMYEIVRAIALGGTKIENGCEITWENCRIIWSAKSDSPTMVVMPNKTVLYCAFDAGQRVTTFRYGSWVEKLKAYSEQITAEKQRAEAEKAEQEERAKLSPFSAISDDEFERATSFKELSS